MSSIFIRSLMLACLVLWCAFGEPQSDIDPQDPQHETPVEADKVATSKPDPVTTAKPDPGTTPKPDPVTTSKPDPVTTSKPDPVTTPKPDPVTTPKPDPVTTEEPPAPVPNDAIPKEPVKNQLEMRDPMANDTLCLKADFSLSFEVSYNDTKKNTKEVSIYVPKLNKTVIMADDCSKELNISVPLTWRWNNFTWKATLMFTSNNNTYNLTGVDAAFHNDPQLFPSYWNNHSEYLEFSNTSILGIPARMGKVYECRSEEAVIVVPSQLVLKVEHLKIQAFEFDDNDGYSKDKVLCTADEPTSTIVPIIVGCVLAALIVLVLVSYLVATRKFKKYHGYETL